jgi:hypothetical protein
MLPGFGGRKLEGRDEDMAKVSADVMPHPSRSVR